MQLSSPLEAVAMLVVAGSGLFLASIGAMSFVAPAQVKAFLLGFAATPFRHYLELMLRAVAGLAFVAVAPTLPASQAYFAAGTILLVTTAIMLAVPWRVHRVFAQRSVPEALVYLPVIGISALIVGCTVLWSAYTASVA
jgi:hypothetical protein